MLRCSCGVQDHAAMLCVLKHNFNPRMTTRARTARSRFHESRTEISQEPAASECQVTGGCCEALAVDIAMHDVAAHLSALHDGCRHGQKASQREHDLTKHLQES